jgi:hypothetical protein
MAKCSVTFPSRWVTELVIAMAGTATPPEMTVPVENSEVALMISKA